MSAYELHADFDRDGVVTGSPAERAARSRLPGAIVVPNLDLDDAALGALVGSAARLESDFERFAVGRRENDMVRLEVRATSAVEPGAALTLRCPGRMHTRISLRTPGGTRIPQRLGHPEVFEIPPIPPSGVLVLLLTVRTIAGAAWGTTVSTDRSYRPRGIDDGSFRLELHRESQQGQATIEDVGHFTVSPFVLVDRTAEATRLYMVSSESNVPSVRDVRRALRSTGVSLELVADDVTGGDTWFQDQYQHAMMQSPAGWTQLLLHLPRMASDAVGRDGSHNLAGLVDRHFRSHDIAVYRDLWDRVLPVRTVDGAVARPTFTDMHALIQRAGRAIRTLELINRFGADAVADSRRRQAAEGTAESELPAWTLLVYEDWPQLLRGLAHGLQELQRAATEAGTSAGRARSAQLEAEVQAVELLVRESRRDFSLRRGPDGSSAVEVTLAGRRVLLAARALSALLDRAEQMHDSSNYGGNIESTPPVGHAPLGKILVGNATFRVEPDRSGMHEEGGSARSDQPPVEFEFMDPDLLQVLAAQRKQPIVELDTSWLRVGHVDEVVSVIPSSRASGGFAVLHASSAAALALIRGAFETYLDGLPAEHHHRVLAGAGRAPSEVVQRLLTDGSSPVTRLFRGKAWLQDFRRADGGAPSPLVEPPAVYLKLCQAFGALGSTSGLNAQRIGYVAGVGTRHYPADITPGELVWAERDERGRSSNAAIDASALARSRAVLDSELAGISVLPVPVLFDRLVDVDRFARTALEQRTIAVTPDVANLQYVNGRLLVPRPYGPRMRPRDAIRVVRDSMEQVGAPPSVKARVSEATIRRRGMTTGTFWVQRVHPAVAYSAGGSVRASYGGMQYASQVVAAFRDSFPDADAEEQERRILRPHRRSFTRSGVLRNEHTRFRIADGMVDLFELFTVAITEDLGVDVVFVDSWHYHVRDGAIHCGTNVLRRPPRRGGGSVATWDAPDHEFRAQRVDFEADNLVVPG